MVHVKVFGLLRLDTGIREMDAEASRVRDLYPLLLSETKKRKPGTKVTAKDIDGCIVVINDRQTGKNAALSDGDTVLLMSPVCGGFTNHCLVVIFRHETSNNEIVNLSRQEQTQIAGFFKTEKAKKDPWFPRGQHTKSRPCFFKICLYYFLFVVIT